MSFRGSISIDDERGGLLSELTAGFDALMHRADELVAANAQLEKRLHAMQMEVCDNLCLRSLPRKALSSPRTVLRRVSSGTCWRAHFWLLFPLHDLLVLAARMLTRGPILVSYAEPHFFSQLNCREQRETAIGRRRLAAGPDHWQGHTGVETLEDRNGAGSSAAQRATEPC